MKSITDALKNQEVGHQGPPLTRQIPKDSVLIYLEKLKCTTDTIPALTGTENFFRKEVPCDSDEFSEENKPESGAGSTSGKGWEGLVRSSEA